MVSISVRGAAVLLLDAERGTVPVRCSLGRDEPAAAVDAVAALHARVVEVAVEQVSAGAATRWTSGPLLSSTEERYLGDDRRERVHVATSTVEVRFRDVAALSRFTTLLAALDGVQVDDVRWSLTTESRTAAEREARVAAVRDATTRAEDYAAAIGAGAPVLQRLTEPGADAQPRGWAAQARTPAMSASAPEVRPEPVEVRAAVLADFTTP